MFRARSPATAFIFTSRLLVLHTIGYVSHVDFFETFRWGLERLKGVEGIQLDWMESVGVRYVNRVTPQGEEALASYLKSSMLPSPIEDVQGIDLEEAVYVSRYRTPSGEMRLQVLRNPPSVLPPELETPLIRKNGWMLDRPERDFAIVDIDHGTRFASLEPMDVADVHRHMLQLRLSARVVFDGMGTEHANRFWRGPRHEQQLRA